jgi:DNA-binding transcriptional LysR family regulator
MDLRHLITFRSVLREGSFLKAAGALRLAQPTVTLHIQELEQELGLELFDRRGRRRPLTRAGELFAERALPILEALDALSTSMAELRDGRSGLLRIGSIEPAASERVTPLLARLRRERPALHVRLDVSGTGGVSRGVAGGDIDVGLCSAPPVELGLRFEPLFAEEVVLLVPQSHRLARAKRIVARLLGGEPLMMTEQGCAYRQAVESALAGKGVRPRWVLESGSTNALRAAAQQKLGIAILPRGAASPAPRGTVVRRLSDLVIALPVGLATRAEAAPAPPALALLLECLRKELGRAKKGGRRGCGAPRNGRLVPSGS